MKILNGYWVIVFAFLITLGCGGAVEQSISDDESGHSLPPITQETPLPDDIPTPNTPQPIPSIEPTASSVIGNLERGRELYFSVEQGCAACHGENGIANSVAAPDIIPIKDTFVFSSEGLELELDTYLTRWMPYANPLLCDEQCSADIALFIRSWSQAPQPNPTQTPNPQGPPSVEPLDCSNMQEVMAQPELNCVSSSCHASPASQAAKVSLVGNIDELAVRLGNKASVNSNCIGEKIIDIDNPSNSLLLKIIDPESGSQCATKMPVGRSGVSPEHFLCFEQWVNDMASSEAVVAEEPVAPFEASPVLSSITKIKRLLHGAAVTQAELDALNTVSELVDRDNIKSLIEVWMNSDEFKVKFMSFLQLSLQQKNIGIDSVYRAQFDSIGQRLIDANKLVDNFELSFVRTAYNMVENDQDFRQIATTRDWQVTTSLLLALSYADYEKRLPFKDEDGDNALRNFEFLCGDSDAEAGCDGIDDYSDWRTIKLSQGGSPAKFEFTQDLAQSLRSVSEGDSFSLLAPRVGFFTTPIFFQSYESNVGNSFRVTANQAMIVGLGLSFEAGDTTPSGDLSALDVEHAGEDSPECYSCHRMLDPMRQVFDNYFVVDKSRALEQPKTLSASFAFQGMQAPLETLDDLGKAIYDHPAFAKAWVGKMCNWATSAPCDQSSAEFLRLVQVFENSGYKMKALVLELFSSPLVSGLSYIDAFKSTPFDGVVLNRTNHFCHSIKTRLNQARESLGLDQSPRADICTVRNASAAKAALLPQDEFSRGQIDLVQSVNLDPFLVTGYKQLCESVQNDVIRFGAGTEGNNYDYIFNASQSDQTLDLMVEYVMGIPPASDLYLDTRLGLQKMFDILIHPERCEDQGLDPVEANKTEVVCGLGLPNAAQALRPVWVAACSSPSSIGMGF